MKLQTRKDDFIGGFIKPGAAIRGWAVINSLSVRPKIANEYECLHYHFSNFPRYPHNLQFPPSLSLVLYQ